MYNRIADGRIPSLKSAEQTVRAEQQLIDFVDNQFRNNKVVRQQVYARLLVTLFVQPNFLSQPLTDFESKQRTLVCKLDKINGWWFTST